MLVQKQVNPFEQFGKSKVVRVKAKWHHFVIISTEGSQFRVTTATHPTTSTQTRSTARQQAHATIPVGQIRNLRPAMQLSSFDRYLPCNSHHIHEPENQQQQPQNPPPRANRINITRTPQVHIQRSVPNSVRFANFLSNHLQNQVNQLRATTTTPTTTSTSSQPQQTSAQSNAPAVTTVGALNDVQLSTPIPIFGSNQVQLQIRDLVNICPTTSTLNRIRSDLRDFLMLKLSLAPNPTDGDVASVIFH